jgi:hypothetical protein
MLQPHQAEVVSVYIHTTPCMHRLWKHAFCWWCRGGVHCCNQLHAPCYSSVPPLVSNRSTCMPSHFLHFFRFSARAYTIVCTFHAFAVSSALRSCCCSLPPPIGCLSARQHQRHVGDRAPEAHQQGRPPVHVHRAAVAVQSGVPAAQSDTRVHSLPESADAGCFSVGLLFTSLNGEKILLGAEIYIPRLLEHANHKDNMGKYAAGCFI